MSKGSTISSSALSSASPRDRHRSALDRLRVQERLFYRGTNDELDDGGRKEEEVGGRNGDVLGLGRVRSHDKAIGRSHAKHDVGTAKPTRLDFRIPVTRGVRPMTADGRTSFHFSHSSISKTVTKKVSSKGVVSRPGAPREHGKYIERTGAVAIFHDTPLGTALDSDPAFQSTDPVPVDRAADGEVVAEHAIFVTMLPNSGPDVQAGRRALLMKLANISRSIEERYNDNADAAGPAGLATVQPLSAVQHMSTLAHISTLQTLGSLRFGSIPARHGGYVERPDALAVLDDGQPAVFTNISPDAQERARFWDVVEMHAQNPGPDKVKINATYSPSFIASLMDDPSCPTDFRAGLETTQPGSGDGIPVQDLQAVREFIINHPEFNPEQPHVTFAPGRGGRTQIRINGELSYELTLRERASIVQEFAKEFTKIGLRYNAAIHAPDHNNDDRNHHFHLDYYGRPTQHMSDGRWDFEVCVEQTDKHGNRRKRYPHRQKMCARVRSIDWVPYLRKRFAEITNDHLAKAKIDRRLDPRTYEKMGIHRKTQDHLGTKASALEAMGHATVKGAANASKDWDELVARHAAEAERSKQEAVAAADLRKAQAKLAIATPHILQGTISLVDQWLAEELAVQERLSFAKDLNTSVDRKLSRAQKTAATCQNIIHAIDAGRAKPSEVKKRLKFIKRRGEAIAYIEHMREAADQSRHLAQAFEAEAAQLQAENWWRLRVVDRDIESARTTKGFLVGGQESGPLDGLPAAVTLDGLDVGSKATETHGRNDPPQPTLAERSVKALKLAAALQSTKPVPKPDIDAMFSQFAKRPVQIVHESGMLVPDIAVLKALGITVSDVSSEPMQRRLRGFEVVQERERKRLESYARSRPSGIVEAGSALGFDDKTPADLRIVDHKWRHDAAYQSKLREILQAARSPCPPVADDFSAPLSRSIADSAVANAVPPAKASTVTAAWDTDRARALPRLRRRLPAPPLAPTAAPGMERGTAPRPGDNRLNPQRVESATKFEPVKNRDLPAAADAAVDSTRGPLKTNEAPVPVPGRSAGDDERRRQTYLAQQGQVDHSL